MNDSHLFKIAREVSKCADYNGNAKLGCVAVYKGAVLAKGFNSDKTHTVQEIYNRERYKNCGNRYLPSRVHAEISVLSKIKYLDIDFSRLHIYIFRELKNGQLAMARPCQSCFSALKAMGVKHIHYTTEMGYCEETIERE